MEKVVISLGGSLIVPGHVNYKYLKSFSKVIKKFSKKYKIVVVTGGGKTAREYISALEHTKADKKFLSLVGIMATKLNARLVSGVVEQSFKIPDSIKEVENLLKKNNVVVCGALGFHADRTTDSNAAEIAKEIGACCFINLTNVKGLYNKDPKKYKNAKYIPYMSLKEFHSIASKIKFKAGQHFVLDQEASRIIKDNNILTVILNGHDIKNLKKLFSGKKFIGTILE